MSPTLPLPPPGFDELSIDDQIEYVVSLWDHIVAKAEQLKMTEWQQKSLNQRLQAYPRDPDAGKSVSDEIE